MKFTAPIWNVTSYARDRRAYRHRCRCCGKVIEIGDAAVMARVANKTTWAIHATCADKRHGSQYSWGEVMKVWAFDFQIKVLGLSETEPRDWEKIEKYKADCGLSGHVA